MKEMGNSMFAIYDWMVKQGLNGNPLIVYALLYQLTDKGESAICCSTRKLMDKTGLSKPTLLRNIKELSEKGLIKKTVMTKKESLVTYYEIQNL